MIADMQTEVEAARSLTWRAGWMADNEENSLKEITMAKLFSAELYAKIANMGVQIMGAYGLCAEYDMQRYSAMPEARPCRREHRRHSGT